MKSSQRKGVGEERRQMKMFAGERKENTHTEQSPHTFASVFPLLLFGQQEVVEQCSIEVCSDTLHASGSLHDVLYQSSHDAMEGTRVEGREESICEGVRVCIVWDVKV